MLIAGQCLGIRAPGSDGGERGPSRDEDPKGANGYDDLRAAQRAHEEAGKIWAMTLDCALNGGRQEGNDGEVDV